MINKSFKKYIIGVLLLITMFMPSIITEVWAQKSEGSSDKQATQTKINEGIEDANKMIVGLTKKIYSESLFSPEDNDTLVELKLSLYDLWTKNQTNRALAKPLYETAIILDRRELTDDAIEFLKIVIDNFPPANEEEEEEGATVVDYSSKAQALLNKITKDKNNP